jgi:hypothetical protein
LEALNLRLSSDFDFLSFNNSQKSLNYIAGDQPELFNLSNINSEIIQEGWISFYETHNKLERYLYLPQKNYN